MRRPIFSKNLENDVRLVWRWLTHCLVVLVACSAPLWAQTPATSLSDLPARVEKSDRIEVTLRDGSIVKGRFDAVAGSSLRIRSSRQMQDGDLLLVDAAANFQAKVNAAARATQ